MEQGGGEKNIISTLFEHEGLLPFYHPKCTVKHIQSGTRDKCTFAGKTKSWKVNFSSGKIKRGGSGSEK